jgi:hypothetical protein
MEFRSYMLHEAAAFDFCSSMCDGLFMCWAEDEPYLAPGTLSQFTRAKTSRQERGNLSWTARHFSTEYPPLFADRFHAGGRSDISPSHLLPRCRPVGKNFLPSGACRSIVTTRRIQACPDMLAFRGLCAHPRDNRQTRGTWPLIPPSHAESTEPFSRMRSGGRLPRQRLSRKVVKLRLRIPSLFCFLVLMGSSR